MTTTKEPRTYEWAHGWIPLTLHAAILKAHGNHGPKSRARKYASEELLSFWEQHGRLTVQDFRAGVLGGHMRHKGGASWA